MTCVGDGRRARQPSARPLRAGRGIALVIAFSVRKYRQRRSAPPREAHANLSHRRATSAIDEPASRRENSRGNHSAQVFGGVSIGARTTLSPFARAFDGVACTKETWPDAAPVQRETALIFSRLRMICDSKIGGERCASESAGMFTRRVLKLTSRRPFNGDAGTPRDRCVAVAGAKYKAVVLDGEPRSAVLKCFARSARTLSKPWRSRHFPGDVRD